MAGGRMLGEAYVTISPDARLFGTQTDAQVKKALAGINANLSIGANTKDAIASIDAIKARVKALSGTLSDLRIGADTRQAESKIASMQAKLLGLTKTVGNITMQADTKKLDAQLAAEVAKLKTLQQSMSDLQVDADTKAAVAKIAALEKQYEHLNNGLEKMEADVDINAAITKMDAIEAELKVLKSDAKTVQLSAQSDAITAQIAAVKARIADLKQQAKDITMHIDMQGVLAAEASILGLEGALADLQKKELETAAAGAGLNAFFKSTRAGTTASAAGWKLLTGHITLFGGALNQVLPHMFTSVAVWHLIADAAIEIVAVWAPAAVAVTAFGLAAEKSAQEVYQRMKDVEIVTQATGQAVAPLTNKFQQMQDAVRPQVYQLFGDALLIMNSRSGALNTVITGTGVALDRLAARFTYAVTTGSGVSKFMEGSVKDVQELGDSIGNLGGIFGAVFKAVPGYAEILLHVGDALTKVLENFAQAAEPVIAFGLLIHGAVIYTGAAVTVILALAAGVVKVVGAFGKFQEAIVLTGGNAIKGFVLSIVGAGKAVVTYIGFIGEMIVEENFATGATVVLGDAMSTLQKIPVAVWLLAAAAAVTAIVLAVRSAKSPTDDFIANMNDLVKNAQLTNVIPTIMDAQVSVTTRLSAAQVNLAASQARLTALAGDSAAGAAGVSNALGKQAADVAALQKEHDQLNATYGVATGRLADLSKEYGGQTQALGALNSAGITTAELLDTNNTNWAISKVQIDATTAAYRAMGQQTGSVGNDLDVLGRSATTQYQAIQKLNSAWSQFIADVTGSQDAFDTVAQGFETLQNANVAVTVSLGKLKFKFDDTKASVDDLTPAGIALNQAFTAQVQNTEKLAETWQTAGIKGNEFKDGIAAAIAPMEQYAKGSDEASAQLLALAEIAGYQGVNSLEAINKYLGISQTQLSNTSVDTQKLKDVTNDATTQEALLTGALQGQGSYIANQLLGDISAAILKYNGVEQAAQNYGNAIAQDGKQSDAAKGARDVLITDLINSGKAAGDSKDAIAAMITKITGIPKSEALQIIMEGTGEYTVQQVQQLTKPAGANVGNGVFLTGATGGLINLGTGPTADDVPAMLSRGEYVVQAAAVKKYGVGMMQQINQNRFAGGGEVPGFASGGMVQTGNTSVLSGQYAVGIHDQFQRTLQNATSAALKNSLVSAIQNGIAAAKKAAEAKAAAAAASAPGGSNLHPTGSGGSVEALMKSMAASVGWTGAEWDAMNYVEMREAGYSLTATNPTSGAYGLAQFINGPSEYADYGGNSTTAAGQITGFINYIKQRYGDPIAAAAHERAYNWYATGGLVPGFAAGGPTGMTPHMAAGGIPHGSMAMDYLGLAGGGMPGFAAGGDVPGWSNLNNSVRAEMGAFWKLMGDKIPVTQSQVSKDSAAYTAAVKKNGKNSKQAKAALTTLDKDKKGPVATDAQAKAWRAWDTALSAQQYKAIGLGTSPPGAFSVLSSAMFPYPGDVPPKDWIGFQNQLSTLIKYQGGTGVAGGLNPPGTPNNSGWSPWHFAHSDWQAVRNDLLKISAAQAVAYQSWQPTTHTYGGDTVADTIARTIATTAGPLGAATGGYIPSGVYDRGGTLKPGPNVAWNLTGKDEHLTRSGGGDLHIHVHNTGVIGSEQELDGWLAASMRRVVVGRGGGDVQKAFGRH